MFSFCKASVTLNLSVKEKMIVLPSVSDSDPVSFSSLITAKCGGKKPRNRSL